MGHGGKHMSITLAIPGQKVILFATGIHCNKNMDKTIGTVEQIFNGTQSMRVKILSSQEGSYIGETISFDIGDDHWNFDVVSSDWDEEENS